MRLPGAIVSPARSLDGYGLALLLLILGYWNFIFFVAIEAILLTVDWTLWAPEKNVLWIGAYSLFLAAVVPLIHHWLCDACRGVLSLVTDRLESPPLDVGGLDLPRRLAPELFQLVDRLAMRLGATSPDRIVISPLAECYAFERRSFAIFPNRQLALVVGLPHFCVVTVSDLEAICAHELAHFRRGDTRLGVFFSRFTATLDGSLRHMTPLGRIDPLRWARRGFLAIFLRLLAPYRRRQELHADLDSARISGGPAAAAALLADWLVARHFEAAVASMHRAVGWNAAASPAMASHALSQETVYERIERSWRILSADGQAYLVGRLSELQDRVDLHPDLAERIRRVQQQPDRSAADPRPARTLIPDFEQIQRAMQARLFHRTAQVCHDRQSV